ncbi:MAG: hypothetical protein ACOC3Z_02490 [Nanoarchaeota archaeon]
MNKNETDFIIIQNEIFHENFLFNNNFKQYIRSLKRLKYINKLSSAYKFIVESLNKAFKEIYNIREKRYLNYLNNNLNVRHSVPMLISGLAIGKLLGSSTSKMYNQYIEKKVKDGTTDKATYDLSTHKQLIREFIEDSEEYLLKLFLDEFILRTVFYNTLQELSKDEDIKSIVTSLSIDKAIRTLNLKNRFIDNYDNLINKKCLGDLLEEFTNNLNVKQNKNKKEMGKIFLEELKLFFSIIHSYLVKKIEPKIRNFMFELKDKLGEE